MTPRQSEWLLNFKIMLFYKICILLFLKLRFFFSLNLFEKKKKRFTNGERTSSNIILHSL
jgi:hypothetical protein